MWILALVSYSRGGDIKIWYFLIPHYTEDIKELPYERRGLTLFSHSYNLILGDEKFELKIFTPFFYLEPKLSAGKYDIEILYSVIYSRHYKYTCNVKKDKETVEKKRKNKV